MLAESAILVGALAESDAIWLPVRSWQQPRPATTWVARRFYPTLGVGWWSGATTDTTRKEAEWNLKSAEEKGLLTIHRPRGRTTHAKLTDRGEAIGRALVGLPGLDAARSAVRELARHCDRQPATMDRLWVPETVMARHPWGTPDSSPFVLVEDMLLPALSREWVESRADIAGRVYYRLTAAGWAIADDPDDGQADGLPGIDPGAWEAYSARLAAALGRLGVTPPGVCGEIGGLPLPASMHGYPVTFPPTPAAATTAPPTTPE